MKYTVEWMRLKRSMQNREGLLKWRFMPIQWQLLIVGFLVAGLVLRGINLDKVYWYDEAFTWLRISGHTEVEAIQTLTNQQLVEATAFQPYQQVNPDKGLADTVRGLATEEPQHTPLYYIFARLWAGSVGDSVSTVRLLSVIFSVLALPCMAWLCWELYQSAWAGWLGMILLAVSPFQVIYAQEARPTALWSLTILLSTAALLRALRVNTQTSWSVYIIALILNLYTYLFSVLVLIVHALYVLILQRGRWTSTVQKFAIALLAGLLSFSPWLIVLFSNSTQLNTGTSWLAGEDRLTIMALQKLWSYHITLPFVDRGSLALPTSLRLLFGLFQTVVRISVLYGLYLLCRRTQLRVWLLVVLLIGVPAVALTLPDLLVGGKRSTIPRYLVPVYLGLELVLTYLLTQYLVPTFAKMRWSRRFWQIAASLVILAGVASSTLIAQSPAWWNKGNNSRLQTVAAQINQTERPLVVSNADLGDLLSLSHYLDPEVRLSVYPACLACNFNRDRVDQFKLTEIPPGFSDVFLYNPRPSEPWLKQMAAQNTYQIETLSEVKGDWYTEYWLWKIMGSAGLNE